VDGEAAACGREEVLVVDDDAVVCAELARRGVPVMRGDGSDKELLQRAGAANARW
jgi:Trk K+ transport system NAD-binding subunit